MDFGSVRFFRRLISLMVVIIIVALIVALCITGFSRGNLKSQVETLKGQLAQTQGQLTNAEPDGKEKENMYYQDMYPELYAEPASEYAYKAKTVYITFDDGPSDVTGDVLDVLQQYGIKATFFVLGQTADEDRALMKRIVDEGHAIGIHSYSHDYSTMYAGMEAFLDDFNKEYQLIYEATGVKTDICRFAGGTINKYNVKMRTELCAEILRRGFTYYDWNATAVDSSIGTSTEDIVKNGIDTSADKDRIILLMHDNLEKSNTPQALATLIEYYQGKGYAFEKITNDVQPITFD